MTSIEGKKQRKVEATAEEETPARIWFLPWLVGWFDHLSPFDNNSVFSFLFLKFMLDFSQFP